MKILGINTASIDSQIIYMCDEHNDYKHLKDSHSENLLPKIEDLLFFNNENLNNMDCFAVNLGPGSFTGIRIGVATIKAFMVALNKPCITFNSFDVISYNIEDNDYIIAIDSGNKDFYYAKYEDKALVTMNVSNFNEIILKAKKDKCNIYCEYDLKTIVEPICEQNNYKKIKFISLFYNSLGLMLKEKYENKMFSNLNDLLPIYIKRSQAEISLEDKIKNGLKIEECKNASLLYNLEKECFEDAWTKKIFEEELSLNDRIYFIAKVEEEVVGYIGLWQTGEDLNLLKIAVLPRFRQLGIAENLLKRAFNFKEENNLEKFFLEVDEHNEKAINLYKKLGFIEEYRREKYYKNGDACLVMFYKGLKS